MTYNQERFITRDMYKRAKDYYDKRNLKEGDHNPNYDTYHPHFHVILAVNKSYFTSRDYLKQEKWLEMWRECMNDDSITQVDIRKVRSSEKSENGAVLEVAKYSAKSNELYVLQSVFEIFYRALKSRQLLTFNGLFKEYVKKYKQGELDQYKKPDENEYTHLLTSVWQTSKYDNMLRQLTVKEFEEYNKKAEFIENNYFIIFKFILYKKLYARAIPRNRQSVSVATLWRFWVCSQTLIWERFFNVNCIVNTY